MRSAWLRLSLAAIILASVACGRLGFDALEDAGGPGEADAMGIARQETFALDVPAAANLFGAGHATPPAPNNDGAGVLPERFDLPAGRARVLRLTSVSGSIKLDSNTTDADGTAATVSVISYGGLVEPTTQRVNAVFAVVLDDTTPADPAPASYVMDTTSARYTGIGLRQMFFVGDGWTGTGSGVTQTFELPDAATRLYVGFSDAQLDGVVPGAYDDNSGSITATVVIDYLEPAP